ncbi:MAG: PTS sugar transporter subunit IIA [Alphaproteobacteria bacterium]|nr:PTS sugar transporter subunit IIA [Alphaproteobacteria bacterium]
MEIGAFTAPQSVIANLRVANKAQLLKELAKRAATATGLNEGDILAALNDRERLGSTGIGKHIALPHARIRGLDRIHGFFARLERPIDFEAIDERPVDLVFLLLAPEDSGKDHLAALARVSRLFRDPDSCAKLRHAESAPAIHDILTTVPPA